MTRIVDVVEESADIFVGQPLLVVVLKAAQLFQQRLSEKHMMTSVYGAKRSVVLDIVRDLVRTKTDRKEGEARTLAPKLYPAVRFKLAQMLKMAPMFQYGQSSSI